ncbi:MAG TPA: biopolymer transporter ExbD [Selenomonadales bacterium]|nr:biopolymer transporter ExbD [Selenomonadales bacterium]
MKLSRLRSRNPPKIMIIPMIDIIFFLLVFFMMSTLYMVEQNTLSVALPPASSAQASQASFATITITAQANIIFTREEIPPELLAARIQAELLRDPETAFILRGDRQVEYGKVIGILDELKKAGVRKITVATELKR